MAIDLTLLEDTPDVATEAATHAAKAKCAPGRPVSATSSKRSSASAVQKR